MLKKFFEKLFGTAENETAPPSADRSSEPSLDPADLPKILEKSKLPFVKIEAVEQSDLPLTASKFLGKPYFPKNMDYPLDRQGLPMAMLAQINFAEVPPLKNYPTAGLLQIFVTAVDGLWGANFDDGFDQTNFRVVFHEKFDPAAAQAELPKLPSDHADFDLPITAEHRLNFQISEELVSPPDFRYEKFLRENPDPAFNDDDFYDRYIDLVSSGGHKIGGYAFFTQYDPRDLKSELENLILLLQIDSDCEKIMWGDVGVANWFIRPADLARRDFSRVFYSWDCH